MNTENKSTVRDILPVTRSKEQAKRYYDSISKIYDYLAGRFERKYSKTALEYLAIKEGEIILEIGFGTGYCLEKIAESVGQPGKVYGVDISSGMLDVAIRRFKGTRLESRAELYCGDAAKLPYEDSTFDAAFVSFTLELFDTPEIPKLLEEVRRVLKNDGRIAVTSLSKDNGETAFSKLYEWIHKKWPVYFDCRPIYVEQSLEDAGYNMRKKESFSLFGLQVEIVIALK